MGNKKKTPLKQLSSPISKLNITLSLQPPLPSACSPWEGWRLWEIWSRVGPPQATVPVRNDLLLHGLSMGHSFFRKCLSAPMWRSFVQCGYLLCRETPPTLALTFPLLFIAHCSLVFCVVLLPFLKNGFIDMPHMADRLNCSGSVLELAETDDVCPTSHRGTPATPWIAVTWHLCHSQEFKYSSYNSINIVYSTSVVGLLLAFCHVALGAQHRAVKGFCITSNLSKKHWWCHLINRCRQRRVLIFVLLVFLGDAYTILRRK